MRLIFVFFRPGSVVADVQVTASGLNEQDILDTVASSSEVQSLRIDPNSVQVRESKNKVPEKLPFLPNFVLIFSPRSSDTGRNKKLRYYSCGLFLGRRGFHFCRLHASENKKTTFERFGKIQ